MKEAIKQKRIGIGSLALALSIIAIICSCNIGWFDNLCLGDVVLNYIGIPCWSNGTSGTHYTVFYGLVFFVPALTFGMWKKNDLFAVAGKWIAGFFIVVLGMMWFLAV